MRNGVFAAVLALAVPLAAQASPSDWEGQVRSVAGKVQAKAFGAQWHDAAPGENLLAGDRLKTGSDGAAIVALPDGSEIKVSSGTLFEFNDSRHGEDSAGSVALFLGKLWARVQKAAGTRACFVVSTPTAVAGVRGTELEVGVADDGATLVSVAAGAVALSAEGGEIEVKAGEHAEAGHGEKPRPPVKGAMKFEAWADLRRKALLADPRGVMRALMAKIKKEEQDLEAALERFKVLEKETALLVDKARLARSGKQKDAYREIASEVEKGFAGLKKAAAAIETARNRLTMNATIMRHAYKAVSANKDLPAEARAELKSLITDLKNERVRLQKLRAEFKVEFRQKIGEVHRAYREFKEQKQVKEKVKSKRKARKDRE
ncbi:MAG: FecR domain-containing protein [Deltaproteobacteria bacterium]|nr:FecR domain-containing protein [Deltaproteobacteria bacterium]